MHGDASREPRANLFQEPDSSVRVAWRRFIDEGSNLARQEPHSSCLVIGQKLRELAFVRELVAGWPEILFNVVAERKLEIFIQQVQPATEPLGYGRQHGRVDPSLQRHRL